MTKSKPLTENRLHLLKTIRDLRLADMELLTLLLTNEGAPGQSFGVNGITTACRVLLEAGYLHRLWKHRDRKFRFDRGSARQVFLLSGTGAETVDANGP